MQQQAARQRRDPIHMKTLRKKFLDRALEYVGVPYAQRYHPPECTYVCMGLSPLVGSTVGLHC